MYMDPDPKVQTDASNSSVVIPKSTVTKPENPTQYMRTYAKDVAQLSGKPVPAPIPAPEKTHPAPISQYVPNDVSFTEPDSSAVEGEKAGDKRDKPEEILHTTKEDEKGIFESVATPTPAAVPPAQPNIPSAAPVPTNTATPSESESRDSILARLRAKINSSSGQPSLEKRAGEMNLLQNQADLGKELPRIPTRENVAPSSEPFAFPVTVPKPEPTPTPAPEPVVEKVAAPTPSPLHTYSSDFADRIDERKANTFSVLAAEQDALPATSAPVIQRESLTPNRWRLVLAGLLLVAGLGIATAAGMFFAKSSKLPISGSAVPSLVTFDATAEIKDSGSGYMTALAEKASEPLAQGTILVTYISLSTSTALTSTPQPGGVLISRLGTNAPEIFLRNASPDSTVGVIHAGSETRPFFIFDVTSYERTFAGMLTWEASMRTDLARIYPAYPEEQQPTATVGISTQPTRNSQAGFVDAVVSNHDVRVYKDNSGRTVLLYGYKDKSTLIIARDEAAFSILLSRLSSKAGN